MRSTDVCCRVLRAGVLGVLAVCANGCGLVPQPLPPEPTPPDSVGGPGAGPADAASAADAGLSLPVFAEGGSPDAGAASPTDASPNAEAGSPSDASSDGGLPLPDDGGIESSDGPADCQQEGAQLGPEGGE